MTIGIPGWLVGANSFGVTISYIEFMRNVLSCRDIRILPPNGPIFTDLDLLILPGGADINPLRYGESPGFYTDKPDLLKEYFDVSVLPRYIANNIPIVGICRGCQAIGVHFGSKLFQDMYHETNKAEDPYKGEHTIRILNDPNGKHKPKVNSRHHQSIIKPTNVDSPIVVLATHGAISDHVEAIRIRNYPIIGIQWHIEDCNEDLSLQYGLGLIKSILKK